MRKNWHEVCYVYDDYDMHDIDFETKAVGLGPFSFFNSCSTGFYMGKDIEILNLEINGKRSKYQYDNYCLDYNVTLKNLQTAHIHLKYKEKPKVIEREPEPVKEKEINKDEILKMKARIFLHMVNCVKNKQNKNILRKYFTKYFKKVVQLQREEDRKNFEEQQKRENLKRDKERKEIEIGRASCRERV